MAPKYEVGDIVRYKPVGGPDSNTSESTGEVTKVLTEDGKAADRNVHAAEDHVRYEIKNQNTGKELTAIYEENILSKADE